MNERRVRWIARAGAVAVRVLGWTWRVRFVNPTVVDRMRSRREPFIHVLWHGELLPLLWTHRNRDVAVMISEHSDGEIIARVARSLGFRTVRGSTSRGAARVLLSASREIEAGYCVAVTVDGPRGPAHVVAPGALVISHRTSAPMIATSATATRAWRLRSWDRFMIPKPFARVLVGYAEPIRSLADSPRAAAEGVDRVREAIEAATRIAAGNSA
jgi:lysophospholipid acyltransferase (LPLAT)-like uncharacterized protein